MSINDCQVDRQSKVQRLIAMDRAFIAGFDWCLRWGVDSMFDNLGTVAEKFDIDGEDINLAKVLKNHPKIATALRDSIAEYAEVRRNEMIAYMIDSYAKKPETAGE